MLIFTAYPAHMLELASRERSQPAPPAVVRESLTAFRSPSARPWLDLLPDEVEPRVLESDDPSRVVWSSLWPDRPQDRIRFDLGQAKDGYGCALRWTLITTDTAPSESKLGHMRYRLNVLINESLRKSYGS
ncbi:hypothetical protein [Allokutzneria albata]|uniref:hypothetical protein n=1 Tax=Allokutzneria albata TaxID=211114 RepID=UPI001E600B19|nr:hypothetical protein [Allokutzneria albata]